MSDQVAVGVLGHGAPDVQPQTPVYVGADRLGVGFHWKPLEQDKAPSPIQIIHPSGDPRRQGRQGERRAGPFIPRRFGRPRLGGQQFGDVGVRKAISPRGISLDIGSQPDIRRREGCFGHCRGGRCSCQFASRPANRPNAVTAIIAAANWTRMNRGADDGAIPAKVLEKLRAIVTAGLAKDVEAVNQ